ncbi:MULTISPECIES: bifunctional cobalt-precorrin-7 (C(5))-methyltransferase/cobalt-precorrin-6B (C(15))-methyltransferase [unclassified Mesorhizobium]|uniref:bifunctional cobalt-precorrin-7 (C(5))-methyltransferase/cobalt-precorrin-6B (C(15))-methyltransferase n=1 Tax=unclassified Mesorhizobium TaxID=325217 RepID=UPI0003CEC336|nr:MULTISPECIES: bifunctional cobalt-precorrin-7 (C(5))-methyltransferase/cobalt-precorrin-6B (C(15))-methyltransferase [unclassified Mesorhizobium]ESX16212.1 precorrin-6y methyltransferase [Mesorhizobium sp. LSJC255A00]ESX29631.1 precorrin-6y methyltransferase [Mesorhizobium sp. LSHC440B00]ESX35446.1 precorrin-6y methyltransferase [Mesorhizobium sp. LSHC432A00]ESX41659.1 precorrin-6y methyltransferase [Mesorhizobium sp. LSHC440A00]ESX76003.1 precorrin-6y methyltransferase [Mesorhizobium sp. L
MSKKQPTPKWLAFVGIGEDGLAGLGDEAKRQIADAETVFGGKRHLALVASLIKGEQRPWPVPFDAGIADVLALAGRRVCVLASGDPFFHGVGATLARKVKPEEMHVIPAPSAISLAAARLGWALQDIETISLHGRPLDLIRPLLHPSARILALTSDGDAPTAIARLLVELDFGASRLTVLEALGGPNEKLRSARADAFDLRDINPLNVLALELESTQEARILPLTVGRADHLFEHDGQITKHDIRAITLAALAPRRGELLWDIGAGSGSIGIEWMLAHPSMRAIAIEANSDRAARIVRNAAHCGVPGLVVVEGSAPKALAGLDTPDAIFIGGGGSDAGVLNAAIKALPSRGRLVANAVTLEMEALLLAEHIKRGGDLTRITISRASPVGSMQAWRPAMPVTQWSWVKP